MVFRLLFSYLRGSYIVKRYGVRLGVPFPANAIDGQVFRFRRVEGKEPLAVFFARLTPDKGIFLSC